MDEELKIGFEKVGLDTGLLKLDDKLRFRVREVRGGEVLARDEGGKFTKEVKDLGGLSLGMDLVVLTFSGWVWAVVDELNSDEGVGTATSGDLHCLLEYEDGRGWICALCYNPAACAKVEFECEDMNTLRTRNTRDMPEQEQAVPAGESSGTDDGKWNMWL